MKSQLLERVGRGVLATRLANYEPADPYYEEYIDDRGKKRRRKREAPPGLSKRDVKILRSVNKRARRLDKGFHICGMRFGWTFLIGLVPVLGDLADFALGYVFVIRKAKQAEIPPELVHQMIVNSIVSTTLGLVPFVGDIALAAYKANSRNAHKFEDYLRSRGQEAIHPSSITEDQRDILKPGAGLKHGEKLGDGTSPGAKPIAAA